MERLGSDDHGACERARWRWAQLSRGSNRQVHPQVVSVGALDVVNVDPAPTVPAKFDDRRFVRRDVRRPRNAGPWERTISKKLRIALSDRVLFPPRFFGN